MRTNRWLVFPVMLFGLVPLCGITSSKIDSGVSYNKIAVSAASGIPTIYLGAATAPDISVPATSKGDYSLVKVTSLGTTKLGGATGEPLYGKQITNLTLLGGVLPVATVDDYKKIYCATTSDVTSFGTHSAALTLDTGSEILGVAGLAASTDKIFAAVHKLANGWGDLANATKNLRGIALLVRSADGKTLEQRGVDKTSAAGAKSFIIDVTAKDEASVVVGDANKIVAFYKTGATSKIAVAEVGQDVTMYWDSTLERLYVGLTDVHRDDPSKEGGACALYVGRDDGTTFTLAPVYSGLKSGTLTANKDTYIGAFYGDGKVDGGQADVRLSVRNINALHTSTGKHYLLVNHVVTKGVSVAGGVLVPNVVDGVYALPIITGDTTTVANNGTASGVAAGIANGVVPVLATMPEITQQLLIVGGLTSAYQEFPGATAAAAAIGMTYSSPFDCAYVSDMFTVGDAVYIGMSGYKNQDMGMYKSAALFDVNGFIMGWTPWERVMGNISRVFGGRLDNTSGSYGFLTNEDGGTATSSEPDKFYWNANTIGATKWQPGLIGAKLAELFPQASGGVNQVYAFDEYTPGFKPGKFSMIVALGYDSVAVIITGEWKYGKLVPTLEFTKGTTVFTFTSAEYPVLKEIAPLYLAEVSRSRAGATGWLFVGGGNGVAVLSDTDGNGWDAKIGLTGDNVRAALGGVTPPTMTFKKLNLTGADLTDVRKIVCTSSFLDIITRTGYFSTRLFADNFKGEAVARTVGTTTVTVDTVGWNEVTCPKITTGFAYTDMIFLDGTTFLVGTTKGLFCGKFGATNEVTDMVEVGSLGPVLYLNYLPTVKGGVKQLSGNLYVLAANFLLNTGKVYRFTVDGTQPLVADMVKSIKDDASPFIDLGAFRNKFVTDGSLGYELYSKDVDHDVLASLYTIAKASTNSSIVSYLGLDLTTNYKVDLACRNPVTGALMLPGDWGSVENS